MRSNKYQTGKLQNLDVISEFITVNDAHIFKWEIQPCDRDVLELIPPFQVDLSLFVTRYKDDTILWFGFYPVQDTKYTELLKYMRFITINSLVSIYDPNRTYDCLIMIEKSVWINGVDGQAQVIYPTAFKDMLQ
jgi:hypothetical protein